MGPRRIACRPRCSLVPALTGVVRMTPPGVSSMNWRDDVVADAIEEGQAEAGAVALIDDVGLVGVGRRRFEIGIAGIGAVDVDEAQRRIELLEARPLDAAGVAQIEIDAGRQRAADVDARETLRDRRCRSPGRRRSLRGDSLRRAGRAARSSRRCRTDRCRRRRAFAARPSSQPG